MPIDFPTPTVVGQEFTVGNITWVWNGTAWDSKFSTPIEPEDRKASVFLLMGA